MNTINYLPVIKGLKGYWSSKSGYTCGLQLIYENFSIEGDIGQKIDGNLETSNFILEDDEFITSITGKRGAIIDKINFITNKKRVYTVGTSKGGGEFIVDFKNSFNLSDMEIFIENFNKSDFIKKIIFHFDNGEKSMI